MNEPRYVKERGHASDRLKAVRGGLGDGGRSVGENVACKKRKGSCSHKLPLI